MKKLILDFSQLCYRSYYAMERSDIMVDYDFWRYNILRMILKVKRLFNIDENDEVILACDSKLCWRKEEFKHYKANRKNRSDSRLEMFDEMDQFIVELRTNFPFIVLRIDKCEADDIIAMLSIEKKKEDIVYIISTDKDFVQLTDYDNVMLYNPSKEDFVGDEWPCKIGKKEFKSAREYSQYHILGAGDDGIPNIMSDDDTFVTEGKRQKAFGDKRIQKVLEEGFEKFCKKQPDDIKKNIKRNIKLIILNKKYIPQDIQRVILMTYNEYTKIINGQAISDYLEQKDMRTLFSKIEDFLI